MGLYVQGQNSTSREFRHRSVDDFDLNGRLITEQVDSGKVVTHGGQKIDLGRDSVINPNDIQEFLRQKRKNTPTYRVRKRTNQLLHTHVALIFVCVLSSLDAACVIGQIICDILIMSDSLYENEKLHERATEVLYRVLPDRLSEAKHNGWLFERVIEYLEESITHGNSTDLHGNSNDTTDPHQHDNENVGSHADNTSGHHSNETTGGQSNEGGSHHYGTTFETFLQKISSGQSLYHRSKRSTSSDEPHAHHDSHTVLEELTHIFHIGSMAILSVLVAEIFLKTFAMWKHFLNHKLEVFDAFVVIVSWCLDVAFWEGIWARPGKEGATILIFILPWRVVRIVNSFVLVIQEKDLVQLKVVKQLLRRALRRERDLSEKLERYKLEVRQLQGLCKKHSIDDKAIHACDPANNPAAGKRRRSSLFGSLQTLAVAVTAFRRGKGHHTDPDPDPDQVSTSSSAKEDDDVTDTRKLQWQDSVTSSGSSNPVTFALSPGTDETPETSGVDNEVFKYDEETLAKFQKEKNNEMMKTRL